MTRIVTRPVPTRAALMLEQSGVHPLLARLYAARGIKDKSELATRLDALLPPNQLKGAEEAATLLADAISPVGGFEAAQEAFYAAARQAGCRIATLDQALSLAPHCASNC